ncbi:F-box/kelch-repeat protein At3g23880-like [Salvia miltiorrhiza]|uniref:F-box/kelch-repeat protein At3g23880-like n=1 Tax=Salvia miltiorrhiza TaxID=226208 RepID=UPI0025AD2CFF|nr:F-box/kelch-repeat protein At3g23880-like [Salvia miltiorrhiza]
MATLPPYKILGCCNGLFCVLKKSRKRAEILKEIYLWNPSTRTSKKLPVISSPGHVRNYGFGWVESSDEYKVFVSVSYYLQEEIKWVGKVYSSRKKSWKTIEHSVDLVSCGVPGIFGGRKIYWQNYGDKEKDIIFLDLKSEVFGRIELPFDQEKYGKVGVLGGFLCVLCFNYERGYQVWVMKES